MDSLFSPFWGLFVHGIPFNPSTAGESKAEFVKRAGVEKWDDLRAQGQDREGMLARFEAALGGLARAYGFADSGTGIGRGRFLEGERPTYADFVVGAWLQFIQATVPEWEVVREWHGGLWGRVIDSLEEWAR